MEEGFGVLSSDLKSATDVIPRSVLSTIYRSFFDGAGYTGPFVDIGHTLLTYDRLCVSELLGETFTSKRGVFMGEPLAKGLLTLYNLCQEEIAIRKYLFDSANVTDFVRPVQVTWRAFAVAGDDHIAYGPIPYLEEITKSHLRSGSVISLEKHGLSTTLIRYCEKLIHVSSLRNVWTLRGINDSTEGYEASPFIDSIKVRLVSPCSKMNDSFNEKNTAIGKAKSLGNTLRWLNRKHFSKKYVSMIRDRFFTRMGSLLPSRSSGCYWHLLLPQDLGGLGLWLEEDLEDLVTKLPAPSRSLIHKINEGENVSNILRCFRQLVTDSTYRGYLLEEGLIKSIETIVLPRFLTGPWPLIGDEDIQFKPLRDLTKEFEIEDLSPLCQIKVLRTKNWYTRDEITDRFKRSYLFNRILARNISHRAFSTEKIKHRYAKIWDETYVGEVPITISELKNSFRRKEFFPLVYLPKDTSVFANGNWREEISILDAELAELPTLRVKPEILGMLI
jgi:hypothetical protein